MDAWVPELKGCASFGKNEAEAIRNVKEAIRGRFDLERCPDASSTKTIQRTVEIELSEPLAGAVDQDDPTTYPGPVPVDPTVQIAVGGAIFIMALIGVGFFFSLPQGASPLLLVAPMIVAAIGLPGVLFGLMSLSNKAKS
jgi:hypothetical protein